MTEFLFLYMIDNGFASGALNAGFVICMLVFLIGLTLGIAIGFVSGYIKAHQDIDNIESIPAIEVSEKPVSQD